MCTESFSTSLSAFLVSMSVVLSAIAVSESDTARPWSGVDLSREEHGGGFEPLERALHGRFGLLRFDVVYRVNSSVDVLMEHVTYGQCREEGDLLAFCSECEDAGATVFALTAASVALYCAAFVAAFFVIYRRSSRWPMAAMVAVGFALNAAALAVWAATCHQAISDAVHDLDPALFGTRLALPIHGYYLMVFAAISSCSALLIIVSLVCDDPDPTEEAREKRARRRRRRKRKAAADAARAAANAPAAAMGPPMAEAAAAGAGAGAAGAGAGAGTAAAAGTAAVAVAAAGAGAAGDDDDEKRPAEVEMHDVDLDLPPEEEREPESGFRA